ncbi:unnamed protein product [Oppiella nova]|uniref:Succinate dehydrogenase assembly factor 4, mitochondrial n=1 Tax=Oppiella nova TaxID=334625 RepID=A0A7R9MFA8_9ACAR|nr:unnamed protein product [Oppiella nova]CAG2176287.1 unnamed protein product [Oppiella nova]
MCSLLPLLLRGSPRICPVVALNGRIYRHFSDGPNNQTKPSKVSQKLAQMDEKLKSDPNSPLGRLDRTPKRDANSGDTSHSHSHSEGQSDSEDNQSYEDPFAAFTDGVNPRTGERGGPTGPEPTRFGDWERKGRVTDF